MIADIRKFTATGSQSQTQMASELAEEIKRVIYQYEQKMPLALALGVLRIVESELLDDAK
jgi:hypothetical protein